MRFVSRKSVLTGLLIIIVGLNLYKSIPLYLHPDSPYDARNIFLAGKLWVKNQNPYNDSLLKTEWNNTAAHNSIASSKAPGFKDCGMIYPFWSIPMLYPYYLGTWPLTKLFIWIFSGLLLILIAFLAHKSFSNSGFGFVSMLLIVLGFKSSIIAVGLGQPMLLSLAAIMASWYFYTKNKDMISGIFLGLAAVKITLCVPFMLLFFLHKKWKLLVVSALIPMISAFIFYGVSGQCYGSEMLSNMAHQMYINYAGHTLTAVNTNLTELGILFNYFAEIPLSMLSIFNVLMLVSGTATLIWLFCKKKILQHEFLALLILWNLLFSYHLIYDALVLIFLIPTVKSTVKFSWVWILLLSPLFLPLNGVFKSCDWIQFHLPISILGLFLYVSYECIKNRSTRTI